MSKHILVDGLIPPPPVMVMTALVTFAIVASPTWGKRAFIAYAFLNAFTFVTNPLMVLQDTYPAITEGSEAAKVGSFLIEVIALYMVMAGVYVATSDKVLGLAYATQIGAIVL